MFCVVSPVVKVKPPASVPDWLSGFVTTTSCAPITARAGTVQVRLADVFTVTLVQACPPTVTVAPGVKFRPAIVTAVVAVLAAVFGVMDETTGAPLSLPFFV